MKKMEKFQKKRKKFWKNIRQKMIKKKKIKFQKLFEKNSKNNPVEILPFFP